MIVIDGMVPIVTDERVPAVVTEIEVPIVVKRDTTISLATTAIEINGIGVVVHHHGNNATIQKTTSTNQRWRTTENRERILRSIVITSVLPKKEIPADI